jgi:hypothetical protein|tara:strand:- start:651 stop:989 length:339 start_codon:yes stop_codon:yes gene_type:complete
MAYFGDNAIQAWVDFSLAAAAIRDDYNVSSLTDNGTGRFTVFLTTSMANTLYTVVATGSNVYEATLSSSNYNRYAEANVRNSGSISVGCFAPDNGTFVDINYCGVIIVGDLS